LLLKNFFHIKLALIHLNFFPKLKKKKFVHFDKHYVIKCLIFTIKNLFIIVCVYFWFLISFLLFRLYVFSLLYDFLCSEFSQAIRFQNWFIKTFFLLNFFKISFDWIFFSCMWFFLFMIFVQIVGYILSCFISLIFFFQI